MKKIFSILFLTILIVKAFPDENEEDEQRFGFSLVPEIATAEYGEDSSPYWKLNLLNLHFLLFDHANNHTFDFEITPVIVLKNRDIPLYNFSFVNFKISYVLYHNWLMFDIKPFLEINYLNLKDKIFDYNTLNFKAGIRIGTFPICFKDLFYIEAGYAYKNNGIFLSIGISPFWIFSPSFPGV